MRSLMMDHADLEPSVTGARVRASQGMLSVTDGPFTETKELIGGYAIVEARSRHEETALGKRFMALHMRVLGDVYDGECEVRPKHEGPDRHPRR